MLWDQPPPQALRFSHGGGESETRVTGDEPQGTMGRIQTTVHFHRERETSGYEAALGSNLAHANVNFFLKLEERHFENIC